jgi:hypothetical protein
MKILKFLINLIFLKKNNIKMAIKGRISKIINIELLLNIKIENRANNGI